MQDVTFTKSNGNLARVIPGEDHISGIMYLTPNGTALPAGFGSDEIKQITDIYDAEAKGITSSATAYKVLHYHISEFFRINPSATLYVQIVAEPAQGSPDFEEIKELQAFADGKIRQVGVWTDNTFATTQVTLLQGVADDLEDDHMPLSILLVADFHSVSDLTTLSNLKTLTAPNVSVIFGQDGAAAGKALYTDKSVTIGCLGAALGALSLSAVSESFAWVKKFNMVGGSELDSPALGNGTLVKDITSSALDAINTKGYIFLRKFVGLTGSYLNDNFTCEAATSDFCYINNVRTIDKAIRNVRTFVLPELNGKLRIDAESGELAIDTIKYFESLAKRALAQMQNDGDLSGYDVYIDPKQDVLSNSNLDIQIACVPYGTARSIAVTIGFATSV
jgi:hypothetical protein